MTKNNPGNPVAFMILIWLAVCVFALCSLTELAHAARLHHEKEYQKAWCRAAGGITEYVLDDRTRVDCLTDGHAIEFDFADNWSEAIGQAGHYAKKTGRAPGIVLIIETEKDFRFLWRLLLSIQEDNRPWAVYVVTPEILRGK